MGKINVGVEERLFSNHHSCVLRAQCKLNMFKDALNKAAVNLVMCVSGQTRAIFLLSLETWMILAVKKWLLNA